MDKLRWSPEVPVTVEQPDRDRIPSHFDLEVIQVAMSRSTDEVHKHLDGGDSAALREMHVRAEKLRADGADPGDALIEGFSRARELDRLQAELDASKENAA